MQVAVDNGRTRRINKVMMIVMISVTILQTLFTFLVASNPIQILVSVVVPLTVGTLVVVTLYVRRLFEEQVKYLMVIFLAGVNFAFVYTFGDLNGIVTIYVVLVTIALYQEAKLIIADGILCGASMFYGYVSGAGESMFAGFNDTSGIINLIFSLFLITYIMTINARSTRSIYREALDDKKDVEESASKMSKLFEVLKVSVGKLTGIEQGLQGDIQASEDISHKVSQSFEGIGTDTLNQDSSLQEIASDMALQVEEIEKVVQENAFVAEFTVQTQKVAEEVSVKVGVLSTDMKTVGSKTSEAVDAIEEFSRYTENVVEVLSAVEQISGQINLLALNASIEAARAGEHGRGFAVVAEEVGKLAEQSQSSTVQISEILGKITGKAEILAEQIGAISDHVQESNKITESVVDIIVNLEKGAVQAADSSKKAMDQSAAAQSYATTVASNLQSVKDISGRTAETVGDALDRVHQQEELMEAIVEKSGVLNGVIVELESQL